MPLIEVIVLGLVQGLTEFLPISSSAHLALVPWLFGWPDPGLSFDIALHIGTLVAIVIYFFKDWVQVAAHGFGLNIGTDPALKKNPKLLWLIALGTIPAGVVGLLFKEQAEGAWHNNQILMGSMLVLVGIFMWWADRQGTQKKDLSTVSLTDVLAIGTAQAAALVPGVSRSGSTISVGLLRDLDRPSAARFSFLLSLPITAAAAAKDVYDLMKGGGLAADVQSAYITGIIISGISGALTIQFFLKFLRQRSLAFFVWYRIIFGIIVVALAFLRPTSG
jgi:undecaprenyl-diphosphatase